MQVKNLRPYPVEIPEVGAVDADGVVEVSDELGAGLCDQVDNWSAVKPAAKKES